MSRTITVKDLKDALSTYPNDAAAHIYNSTDGNEHAVVLINNSLSPFDIKPSLESNTDTWATLTHQERQDFIAAGVTFNRTIEYYAAKYRNKHTLKGEFIACILYDFYFDLFETPLNSLRYELDNTYLDDNLHQEIKNYTDRLLEEAMHPHRWIKVLKKIYHDNKQDIIKNSTDDKTGKIDLKLVNDFSVEYRDYLY